MFVAQDFSAHVSECWQALCFFYNVSSTCDQTANNTFYVREIVFPTKQ